MTCTLNVLLLEIHCIHRIMHYRSQSSQPFPRDQISKTNDPVQIMKMKQIPILFLSVSLGILCVSDLTRAVPAVNCGENSSGIYECVEGDDEVSSYEETSGYSQPPPPTIPYTQQPEPATIVTTQSPTTADNPKQTANGDTPSPTDLPKSSIVPEVQTKSGIVRGKVVVTKKYRTVFAAAPTQKEVVTFLGIPFAKPPIGDLRFKRPVAFGKWNGVRDATSLPNTCPQKPSTKFPGFRGESQWNPNTPMSEDCLYLNIWVPASVFENRSSGRASVMFWIHGGGFHSGSSTLDNYNGASLASENGVIVVSTQYRIGALGFLYFGVEEAPGNLGLIDQSFALQWVNDNIAGFGGDPASVTIFGESAGAACVTYQLLTPLSRSLFKRAIIMSGIATASWAFRPKTEALETSYKIAKEVGCWSEDSRSTITQVVECMRKVNSDALVTAQFKDVPKSIEQIPVYPTVDDYFLLDTPETLIQNWDTKKADVIIGTTADEGTYFLLYAYPKYFNHDSKSNISYDVFVTTLRDIFDERPEYERDAIIAQYTNWLNPDDGYENQKRIGDALGDAFFTCPSRDFAQKWAARGSDVWYYNFGLRSSSNPWANWMGAMHADDIEYAFGQPITSGPNRPVNEMDVSLHFMVLLTNFAKNGIPSTHWQTYTADRQVYLNINGTTITDQSSSQVYGPRSVQCAFWNNYLPRLRQSIEQQKYCKSQAEKTACGQPAVATPFGSRRQKPGWYK